MSQRRNFYTHVFVFFSCWTNSQPPPASFYECAPPPICLFYNTNAVKLLFCVLLVLFFFFCCCYFLVFSVKNSYSKVFNTSRHQWPLFLYVRLYKYVKIAWVLKSFFLNTWNLTFLFCNKKQIASSHSGCFIFLSLLTFERDLARFCLYHCRYTLNNSHVNDIMTRRTNNNSFKYKQDLREKI